MSTYGPEEARERAKRLRRKARKSEDLASKISQHLRDLEEELEGNEPSTKILDGLKADWARFQARHIRQILSEQSAEVGMFTLLGILHTNILKLIKDLDGQVSGATLEEVERWKATTNAFLLALIEEVDSDQSEV